MSCVFCESSRNMIGAAEGEWLHVEEICIERILCFNKGTYTGDVFRIIVELPKGSVMTVPINYCPMCGERFPEVIKDSLKSIRDDMTLGVCVYAKKRGIGHGVNASDKQASCTNCEWGNGDNVCGWLMRNDLADRLGKLLDEEHEQ